MENEIKYTKGGMAIVGRKVSFAEAEEIDIEFYAFQNWKESAELVEGMRKEIWKKEYKMGMEKIGCISKLQVDRE